MHLAAVTLHITCVYVCVLSGPVSLCSNRSGIGLGMAAWSLAHHTSQPQPLSADYKLQSRLQIMTKDVLGRLEDVQQKTQTHIMTCLHMNTHAHTLTQRSLGMHQFINIWSINNPKWDVKVVYKTWQANICIHVGLDPPPPSMYTTLTSAQASWIALMLNLVLLCYWFFGFSCCHPLSVCFCFCSTHWSEPWSWNENNPGFKAMDLHNSNYEVSNNPQRK